MAIHSPGSDRDLHWARNVTCRDPHDHLDSLRYTPLAPTRSTFFHADDAGPIWVDGRSRKKHVYSARLPAGGPTWSANLRVTSEQNNTKAAPDIAIDGNGVVHAVWGQQGQVWGVWLSSLPAGAGAWTSPIQLGTTSQALTLPQIAADGTGRLTAPKATSYPWAFAWAVSVTEKSFAPSTSIRSNTASAMARRPERGPSLAKTAPEVPPRRPSDRRGRSSPAPRTADIPAPVR